MGLGLGRILTLEGGGELAGPSGGGGGWAWLLIYRRLEAKINRLYQNVHTKCNHYGCQTITVSIIYQRGKKRLNQ
jgi:hypothetical protein